MRFALGRASLANLKGVHPHLIAVACLAITDTEVDFSVVEGVRTLDRQEDLVAQGVSTTLHSRHLTGHAIDVYPWVEGQTSHAITHYLQIKTAFRKAARTLRVPLEWGGDWVSFVDMPHWQLPIQEYPGAY